LGAAGDLGALISEPVLEDERASSLGNNAAVLEFGRAAAEAFIQVNHECQPALLAVTADEGAVPVPAEGLARGVPVVPEALVEADPSPAADWFDWDERPAARPEALGQNDVIDHQLGHSAHRLEGAHLLDQAEQLFEHTLLGGDVVGAFRVAQRTLGGFSHLGLRLGEFERGLRLVRALESVASKLPADAQWRVVYDRGLYSAALGDLDDAVRAYRALLARDQTNATTHRTLAYTLRLRGELDAAHGHVARSIQIARNDGLTGAVLRGLALQGALLTSERRLSEASAAFDAARALADSPTARRSIWEAEYFWLRATSSEP